MSAHNEAMWNPSNEAFCNSSFSGRCCYVAKLWRHTARNQWERLLHMILHPPPPKPANHSLCCPLHIIGCNFRHTSIMNVWQTRTQSTSVLHLIAVLQLLYYLQRVCNPSQKAAMHGQHSSANVSHGISGSVLGRALPYLWTAFLKSSRINALPSSHLSFKVSCKYPSHTHTQILLSKRVLNIDLICTNKSREGNEVTVTPPPFSATFLEGERKIFLWNRAQGCVTLPSTVTQYSTFLSLPSTVTQYSTFLSLPSTVTQNSTFLSLPSTATQNSTFLSFPSTVTQNSTLFFRKLYHFSENFIFQYFPV